MSMKKDYLDEAVEMSDVELVAKMEEVKKWIFSHKAGCPQMDEYLDWYDAICVDGYRRFAKAVAEAVQKP